MKRLVKLEKKVQEQVTTGGGRARSHDGDDSDEDVGSSKKGAKAGKKKKDGKPMYRAADHLKDDVEIEISPEVEKLIESGLFSDAEIAKITNIQEADIADILARLEKKRISKGGDPEESPLPAMKKYHADKKKKAKK